MEIKVQCDCGQKFKFDVEPVNGRMPFTVNCPVCGADGTPRANVILQQLLPPQPISVAPAAPPPPPPAAAPAPISMRPAGLSISRPAAPAAVTSAPQADAPGEGDSEDESGSGVRVVKMGWKGWGLVALFIVLAMGGSYLKSAQRSFVRDTLDWVFEKVTGKSTTKEDGALVHDVGTKPENVLPNDDGTMVLVKTADAAAVAQACVDFYADHNKQKLFSIATTNDTVEGLFQVHKVDGGYVEIDGSLFWEEKDVANLTALSEFLSKKFSAPCVCALMGDDAETGTVAIYENGERKFRCDRSMRLRNGDLIEDVKLDGQAWASGLGFKPGEDGWKGFTMDDADNLAQHLGFKPTAVESHDLIVLANKPAKP